MRAGRWRARAATVAAVVGAAVLCSAAPVGATLPQLTVTGSSFAGVAITQWQGAFNEIDGGNIDFTVSSSILGMNNFCQQTVNVGATDISYDTDQANCTESQVPYPFQYMPDVAGGLAFEYNLEGLNGQQITNLVLSAPVLEGIFTGAISTWNAPAIQSLNPNVPLPDQKIVPYYRSDPCGENYLLSDYFLTVDPSLVTDFDKFADVDQVFSAADPVGASATWAAFPNGVPTSKEFPNASSLFPAAGADPASQGPVHTEGGISYVETAYAKNVDLPVASVVNQAGYAVQPTSYNVATALTTAILYSDLTQNLQNVYTNPDQDAYPISAYSYFLAQCVPAQAAAQNFACDGSGSVTMSASQGAEMAQFITFVACQGQARMAALGYSPLPANLVEDDFQAAGRLPGGTSPPPPTASNCADPYIDGQLQPLSQPQVEAAPPPSSQAVSGPVAGSAAASGGTGSIGGGVTYAGTGGQAGVATGSAGQGTGVAGSGSGVAGAAGGGGEGANAFKVVLGGGGGGPSGSPAYEREFGLQAAAFVGLRGWSAARVALWCGVFAVVVVVPTLGAWLWQRRRGSRAGTASGTAG